MHRLFFLIQADKKRSRIVKKSPLCGGEAARKALELDKDVDCSMLEKSLKKAHFNADDRQMRELDMAMRNQTNDIQNQIVKLVYDMFLI